MKREISIALARQSIEHILAVCDASDEIKENVKHGCLVLAWLEKRSDLVKSIAALDKARPDLMEVLRVFPDAEITDILVKESA
jgi:hypothetical protein